MAVVSAATSEYKIQSVQLLCYQTNTVTKRADTFSNKNYTSMQRIKDFFSFLMFDRNICFIIQVPIWFLTGYLLLLLVIVFLASFLPFRFETHFFFFCTRLNFLFFVGVIKKVDNNILECVQLHPNKRLLLFLCFLFF